MKPNYIKITERPHQKTSELLEECKSLFNVRTWKDDLKEFDKDFSAPKQATVSYFRNRIEADEEHKNKSVEQLEKEGIKGITLRQRLIWELEYFYHTGENLDIDNITLCSGSRYSDGSVPGVYWNAVSGGPLVGWHRAGNRRDYLRSREQFDSPSFLPLVPSLSGKTVKVELDGKTYEAIIK